MEVRIRVIEGRPSDLKVSSTGSGRGLVSPTLEATLVELFLKAVSSPEVCGLASKL